MFLGNIDSFVPYDHPGLNLSCNKLVRVDKLSNNESGVSIYFKKNPCR